MRAVTGHDTCMSVVSRPTPWVATLPFAFLNSAGTAAMKECGKIFRPIPRGAPAAGWPAFSGRAPGLLVELATSQSAATERGSAVAWQAHRSRRARVASVAGWVVDQPADVWRSRGHAAGGVIPAYQQSGRGTRVSLLVCEQCRFGIHLLCEVALSRSAPVSLLQHAIQHPGVGGYICWQAGMRFLHRLASA